MIRTRGLSHINLNVTDIERSMRFYRETFGFELLHDYAGPIGDHPWGRQVVMSTPGASDLIALSQIPGDPIGPAGINHFGLSLLSDDDLDDAIAQVERAGGRLVRRGSAEVDNIIERFVYVQDPDGYILELNAQRVLLARKPGAPRVEGSR
jgi:catechol 2,3-dioxygenase-like lactoylglutathione lyase family enzyme